MQLVTGTSVFNPTVWEKALTNRVRSTICYSLRSLGEFWAICADVLARLATKSSLVTPTFSVSGCMLPLMSRCQVCFLAYGVGTKGTALEKVLHVDGYAFYKQVNLITCNKQMK